MTTDPFAGIVDDQPLTPAASRDGLLDSARRGFAPIHNVFVQHPQGAPKRGSALGRLVNERQVRPLDALLLVHALYPVIDGDPLSLKTWAHIMSTARPCSAPTMSKTFRALEDRHLIARQPKGRATLLTPLREDGTNRPWTKPGNPNAAPEGYFALPHEYWTQGWADTLSLPGKAMLLIALKETQGKDRRSFAMAIERAQEWYGVSERTAERGFAELDRKGLLVTHIQNQSSPRLPPGVTRKIYHRALIEPFSTDHRAALQAAARKASAGSGKS